MKSVKSVNPGKSMKSMQNLVMLVKIMKSVQFSSEFSGIAEQLQGAKSVKFIAILMKSVQNQ